MISQLDNAEKEFLLALQESPDDPYANFYMGTIAVPDHNYTKARPYLEKVVSTHVEELETRVLLGRCYIGLVRSQFTRPVQKQYQRIRLLRVVVLRLDQLIRESLFDLAEIDAALDIGGRGTLVKTTPPKHRTKKWTGPTKSTFP